MGDGDDIPSPEAWPALPEAPHQLRHRVLSQFHAPNGWNQTSHLAASNAHMPYSCWQPCPNSVCFAMLLLRFTSRARSQSASSMTPLARDAQHASLKVENGCPHISDSLSCSYSCGATAFTCSRTLQANDSIFCHHACSRSVEMYP
jgi:hypothetical protein